MGTTVADFPVLGSSEWLREHDEVHVSVAIGSPADRKRACDRLSSFHRSFATLIHPSAILGDRCWIGEGATLYPGVVLDPDVQIGRFALINKLCSVGHDTTVGSFVTLAPGINVGGAVTIGDGCELGIGSATIQGVSIGEWSVIGAGGVVVRDVPPNVTAIGVPASPVKSRQQGWHEEA